MFAEISAAIASAKTMLEISKTASDVTKQAELASISLDFNQKLLSLVQKCNELVEENESLKSSVTKLKEQLKKREDFDREAQAYRLQEVASGVFAYVANDVTRPDESTRKYCADCFERGKLSILQQSHEPSRHIGLSCNACMAKMVFPHYIVL